MFDKFLDKFSNDRQPSAPKKSDSESAVHFAPNTKIAYKPTLVPTLENEHRQLVALYWKVLTAAQNRKTSQTRQHLIEFKDLLVEHLLKESTSLYIYLRHTAKKPSSQEAVRSVKSEMDRIARNMMRFLDEAINDEDNEFDSVFIERLQKVGDALMHRIEREEAYVYPNYKPN